MLIGFNSELKKVRPSLYSVAPMTYLICWGYAVVNVLLGLALFFLYDPQVPIAVANIFTYQMWGIIFGSIGTIGTYALLANEWKWSRNILLMGLAVKALWAIALLYRCFVEPQTVVITLVWLFFAYLQAVAYVFFTPKINGVGNGGSAG